MSKNNVAGTSARPLTIDATLMKPASDGLWHAVAPPARRGFWLLCIFAGGFGLWSFLAPLDGGAVAPGVVGPDTNRDVLVRYIMQQGTINPSADFNWSFKPIPGTSAVFESGPKAKAYVSTVKAAKIEDAGDGANGFAKYRIVLG